MKTHRLFAPALAGQALISADLAAPKLRAETYVLMIYESAGQLAARTDPVRAAGYWRSFAEFGREIEQAGLLRGGSAFDVAGVRQVAAPGPRTERPAGSGPGPSGYFVIEAPSLDEALRWAGRAPNLAHGGTVAVFPAIKSPAMK